MAAAVQRERDAKERLAAADSTAKACKIALLNSEKKLKEYLKFAPALLMLRYPNEPLKALWELLSDDAIEGPSAAMTIINDPRCGPMKRILIEDDDPFWSHTYLRYMVSPLLCTVVKNRLEIFTLILMCIKVVSSSMREPLEMESEALLRTAAALGRVEFLRHLISYGLDINSKVSCPKRVPLHYAALKGHLECVALLIASKAVINAQDADGFRPLHLAAERGHFEVVKLLRSTRG